MTLNRKLLRSTGKNLSFYLTASLLTALTIMLWVGAFSVAETLKCTYTDLFDKARLEDACFTVSNDISDDEASALENLYAVTLEKQEYRNTTVGDTRLRVFADTEKIDLTQVTDGTGISERGDALITCSCAKANGINIGDDIELFGQTFKVCGYCIKPDYAAMYVLISIGI